MTTLEMEIKLMHYFDVRRNVIVPCVSNWSDLVMFETDLLILSRSKYATAIEIKVSKSDLKNDLNKKHISQIDKWVYNGKFGFDHYFSNLKYFYYAVPEELQQDALSQIPSWSGLLTAKIYDGNYKIFEVRKPKVLFKTKWTDKMAFQLARLGAMRILSLKENKT